MKKLLIGVVTASLLLLGATSVIGATFKSPPVYAEIKGITVEEAYAERKAGNMFGALAEDPAALEEFKAQMLENKKAFIQEKVVAGELTQEQADSIIAKMEEMIAACDGTMGNRGMGERMGSFFGKGFGMGRGNCWNTNGAADL